MDYFLLTQSSYFGIKILKTKFCGVFHKNMLNQSGLRKNFQARG